MKPFIIRNDDVFYDTDLKNLQTFCEICDRHGFRIMQAITPMGEYQKANRRMQNEEIILLSHKMLADNQPLVEYLKYRDDLIAVHGLWHTHEPTVQEISIAKHLLWSWGLKPTFYVPPFNEGNYPEEVAGLKTCQLDLKKGERLEDFLDKGTPTKDIMYLHSWRFGDWYTFQQLDDCLGRLCQQ